MHYSAAPCKACTSPPISMAAVAPPCGCWTLPPWARPARTQCAPQGCRGKDTSCNVGEFCCGKELFTDASTCPAPAQDGQCFFAPDPFCRACDDDDGCADIDDFGQASHCYELTREDENGQEQSFGKFCSVGCRDNNDCPRGLRCIRDLPTPDGGTTQGCIELACAGFDR